VAASAVAVGVSVQSLDAALSSVPEPPKAKSPWLALTAEIDAPTRAVVTVAIAKDAIRFMCDVLL